MWGWTIILCWRNLNYLSLQFNNTMFSYMPLASWIPSKLYPTFDVIGQSNDLVIFMHITQIIFVSGIFFPSLIDWSPTFLRFFSQIIDLSWLSLSLANFSTIGGLMYIIVLYYYEYLNPYILITLPNNIRTHTKAKSRHKSDCIVRACESRGQ